MKNWVMVEDLPEVWYRETYERLREGRTLRQVRAVMVEHGCPWSIGAWSKYERGELRLSRVAKNGLRRYAVQPELPPPPAMIVSGFEVERVVQVADRPRVVILTDGMPKNGVETPVTRPRKARSARLGITVCRRVGRRLKRLKMAQGSTWDEFEDWLCELGEGALQAGG